jgi:hypothetical protein
MRYPGNPPWGETLIIPKAGSWLAVGSIGLRTATAPWYMLVAII